MDSINSADFEDQAKHLMNRWHVPGMAIAIIHKDEITTKAFGQSSLDPPTDCTTDTIFDIASVSKSLTAAAVAVLVEDEAYPTVQWDTPVSQLLPEFVLHDPVYTKQVTVEDILSHRSGLPRHDNSVLGINAKCPDTVRSVTTSLRHLPLAEPIRTKFLYNNLMYTVATDLVETISGISFSQFLSKHFFVPLKLRSTYLQPDAVKAAGQEHRFSRPYVWVKQTEKFQELPYLQSPEAQGAGSICTTVEDFILWVRAMLKKEGPLKEEFFEELIKPRMITNPTSKLHPHTSFETYALGWEVRFYRGAKIVQHDGLINGYGSSVFFMPEHDFGAVIFGNSSEGGNDIASIINHMLVDQVLGVPAEERPDWDGMAMKMWEEDDLEKDVQKLKDEYHEGIVENEPQTLPLETYTGEYWNDGYKLIEIMVKDGLLFMDGLDRSMPFTLIFEHIREQKHYIARLGVQFEEYECFRVEFELDDGTARRVGIAFEEDLDELIWFDRVESKDIAVHL